MGTKPYKWTTQRTVDLGVGWVTHSFLVIPECPYSLLGCDFLTKMRVQIHFTDADAHFKHLNGKADGVFLTMPLEEEYHLHKQKSTPKSDMGTWLREFPTVCAERVGMGLARHWPPKFVELMSNADPVKVQQYPKTLEDKKGITPHRRQCLWAGILWPIQSTCDMPLLSVKKPHTNDYRPVRDLRDVNKRSIPLYLTLFLAEYAPTRKKGGIQFLI